MAKNITEYLREEQVLREKTEQPFSIILGKTKDGRYITLSTDSKGLLITSLLAEYTVNDIDNYTNANITYIGMEDRDGNWVIVKIDSTTGIVIRYASKKNNPNITDYATAWSNRTTLNYDYLKNVI